MSRNQTCVFSSHDKFKELMNKELSLSDLNKEKLSSVNSTVYVVRVPDQSV